MSIGNILNFLGVMLLVVGLTLIAVGAVIAAVRRKSGGLIDER